MYINPEKEVGIIPLIPRGTNSTLFTECCRVAICDNQKNCPVCNRKVVGSNAKTDHERSVIRWENATRYWIRRKGN